jgi:hypothetical protein
MGKYNIYGTSMACCFRGFPPIILGKKERKRRKRNQKRKEGGNFPKWQKSQSCQCKIYSLASEPGS